MSDPTPSTNSFLKPGRLSDILALIQVLAYDKLAKRTHSGLLTQLRRSPLTAESWISIGKQHPELFRVLEAEMHSSNEETITLIARFLQEGIPSTVPGEPPKSPPLTPEVTGKLIDLAIQLHDREAQRRDRWKSVLIPMVVAIVAAAASIISAIIGYNSKVIAPQASQIIVTQPTHETKVPAKKDMQPPNVKESGQHKSE